MTRVHMTMPRCIRPGSLWFVTRRTTRRHHLLRPDANGQLQSLYWYTTAVVARELGIKLHAVQLLSNHMHEVLTDTRGVLPRFLQERNRLLANAIKVHRRWPEEVFARRATHCAELYGANAVRKEIVYTLANCITAGLVDSLDEWRGVTTTIDDMGKRVVRVRRPNIYFTSDNPRWPEYAEISVDMPEVLSREHADTGRAKAWLKDALDEACRAARKALKRSGRVAAGMKRVFKTQYTARADSPEAFRTRLLNYVSAGDGVLARLARAELRAFVDAYRTALHAFQSGFREAIFPWGTWQMRVRHNALCASG